MMCVASKSDDGREECFAEEKNGGWLSSLGFEAESRRFCWLGFGDGGAVAYGKPYGL